jgi:hypothetical protein
MWNLLGALFTSKLLRKQRRPMSTWNWCCLYTLLPLGLAVVVNWLTGASVLFLFALIFAFTLVITCQREPP